MKLPEITTVAHCDVEVDFKKILKKKNLLLYFFPEIDFDDVNSVTQEAYLFKNYFVRLNLNENEVIGITDDSRDMNELFIQRFNIPFHLIYDRDHQIAEKMASVLNGADIKRTLVCVQKGGAIKGVYQGNTIEHKVKEMVQYHVLPWYKKLLKKSF